MFHEGFLKITPDICNENRRINPMSRICEILSSGFVKNLSKDLEILLPAYEDDPQRLKGDISYDRIESLLKTLDSSIETLTTLLEVNPKNTKLFDSSVFASIFSSYMKFATKLLSYGVFPGNLINIYIGVFSELEKLYVDFLIDPNANTSVENFRIVWNRNFKVFKNFPKLIKSFDFPSYIQKIENISQYALSIPPEENIHASDVFDFVKSFKEKITKLDYNSPYSQFQNLINDLASFRENLIILEPGHQNSSKLNTISTLITNLEISKAILNFTQYLIRLDNIIKCESFSIDQSDFISPDSQLTAFSHLVETALFELKCLSSCSSKLSPIPAKKAAANFLSSLKNSTNNISSTAEKFVELLSTLTAYSEEDYEMSFISTMKNVRAPDAVFEQLKNTINRAPITLNDFSARLSAFLDFEEASKMPESADTTKFKEYLIGNILCTKMQYIRTVLHDVLPHIEVRIKSLQDKAKLRLNISYLLPIVKLLHKMIDNKIIPKESRLFSEFFALYLEYYSYISIENLNENIDDTLMIPPPRLIKEVLFDPKQIHMVRILISKIQKCSMIVTDTVQTGSSLNQITKDVILQQFEIMEKLQEYTKQLYIILNNVKISSRFFNLYSKFFDLTGYSAASFKIIQNDDKLVNPVIVKNIFTFAKSFLKLIESKFLIFKNSRKLLISIATFLKTFFLNENADTIKLFVSILDNITSIDFSKALMSVFRDFNYIEAILITARSKFKKSEINDNNKNQASSNNISFSNSSGDLSNIPFNTDSQIFDITKCLMQSFDIDTVIQQFQDIWLLFIHFIINFENVHKKADSKNSIIELNQKINIFLNTLIGISPALYSKVQNFLPSLSNFLHQIYTLKSISKSIKEICDVYSITNQYDFQFNDIVFSNYVIACFKSLKKIGKSEYISSNFDNFCTFNSNLFKNNYSPYQKIPIKKASKIIKIAISMKSIYNKFDFIQTVQPVISNLITIISNSDSDIKNAKLLIKLFKILQNKQKYGNDLGIIYKFKKVINKIQLTNPLNQCTFIDIYNSLEKIASLEENILHINRMLFVAHLFVYEQIKNDSQFLNFYTKQNVSQYNNSENQNSYFDTGQSSNDKFFNMQLQEILMKSQDMMKSVSQLVNESRWMHGPARENLLKLVNIVENLDSQIKISMKNCYQNLESLHPDNIKYITAIQKLIDRNMSLHHAIDENRNNVVKMKQEFINNKNILNSKLLKNSKQLESLYASNVKKRIRIQELTSQLQILKEQEEQNMLQHRNNEKMGNTTGSLTKPIKIIPFKPVAVFPGLELMPAEMNMARKTLNEAVLENKRLKALLASRISQIKPLSQPIPENVVDCYFKRISHVKLMIDKQEKPISSEINIDKIAESLLNSISDFRRNATESRQDYSDTAKILIRNLDQLLGIYRIQKEKTSKIRKLIRESKLSKENYKSAVIKLLENETES